MNKLSEKIWFALLKGQKPEKSDRIVYFYGTFVLIVIFIIFLIVSKLHTSNIIKSEDQKNKLVAMEELKTKETEIKEKYTGLQQEIVKLKDKFVIEEEVEPIKTSLARYAQRYEGNNISTMPQSQVREGIVTKIPVKMGMEVNFGSLVGFLSFLEHSNKFIDVSHVALNTIGEGGKKLRADFTMNLYLLTPDVESMIDNILPEVKAKKEMFALSSAERVPAPSISRNIFLSPTKVEEKPVFAWPAFKLEAIVHDGATISVEDRKYYYKRDEDYIDQKRWPTIKVLSVESMRVILINTGKEGGKRILEIGESGKKQVPEPKGKELEGYKRNW